MYIFQDYLTWNSGREESAFSILLHIVLYYCVPRFPPILTVLYRKRSIVERERGGLEKRMEFLEFLEFLFKNDILRKFYCST